jgi:nucleoside-diphosphate-sugar epimerase
MNLVTGGTGLVGCHILIDLLKQNKKVRAIRRENSNIELVNAVFKHYGLEELSSKIEWVNADVLDIPSLESAIKGVTNVYHSAAIVSFNKKHFKKMYEVNVQGTSNVVNVSLSNNVSKIGHISSIAAIGREKTNLFSENNKWKTDKKNSYYAITKYSAEREIWRAEQEGLPTVIVNPGIIFGPSSWHRSSTTLFKQISRGLSRYTPGTNGFVDVRDVSKSIVQLVESEISSERFILVGQNLSYKEVFEKIATAMNKPAPNKEAKKWMMEVAWRYESIRAFIRRKSPTITKETAMTACEEYFYDASKIKKTINFEFNSIEESIKNTAKFL